MAQAFSMMDTQPVSAPQPQTAPLPQSTPISIETPTVPALNPMPQDQMPQMSQGGGQQVNASGQGETSPGATQSPAEQQQNTYSYGGGYNPSLLGIGGIYRQGV